MQYITVCCLVRDRNQLVKEWARFLFNLAKDGNWNNEMSNNKHQIEMSAIVSCLHVFTIAQQISATDVVNALIEWHN